MQVQFDTHRSFCGHGARNINQVMSKLYKSAYNGELYPHTPDIIQISARMNDGTEVSGVANFVEGMFEGLSFPYEHVKYRSEFCNKIISKYNQAITKGKYKRK